MNILKAVPINIRRERILKNHSQEYVAGALKISKKAYHKIELGQTAIKLSTLLLIAEILDLDVMQLLQQPIIKERHKMLLN